jgi:VWFA-related protein
MRKIAVILLLLSLSVLAAQPLRAQSRPRRVGQTPGTPQPAPQQPSTNTRAPVLGGRTGSTNPQPAPQEPQPQNNGPEEVDEGDVVRVNTTLVTVPVSVMDRDGKYIPNLRQQDFRIYEDGVEQQIAYFASVEKPFTVALVIDTSGSTRFRLDEIQNAAIAFINQLRPDDRVMVISFDDDIKVLAEATSDRYTLYNAIRRTEPGDGTRIYDAVDFVINQRLNRISGRKAVVLFTDGVDTTSRRSSYSDNVRDAEELDALIYPVQYDTYQDVQGGGSSWPGGGGGNPSIIFRWPMPFPFPFPFPGGGRGGGTAGSSRGDYVRADNYLHDLADKTGARVYPADSTYNLERSFGLIAEELRRQYSLGYYPTRQAQAGQRRQIAVKVNRPNMVVRARDSYISDPSASGAAQGRQGQQSGPVLRPNPLARQRFNGQTDTTQH